MGDTPQTTVRNPDGSWTVDMWGVSYAPPMDDLTQHPPMALFFHAHAATRYRDKQYHEARVEGRAFAHLDVRLLRVTVAQWTPPAFEPARGQLVRARWNNLDLYGYYVEKGSVSGHRISMFPDGSGDVYADTVYPFDGRTP